VGGGGFTGSVERSRGEGAAGARGSAPDVCELEQQLVCLARPLREGRARQMLGQAEGLEGRCNCACVGHRLVHVLGCEGQDEEQPVDEEVALGSSPVYCN